MPAMTVDKSPTGIANGISTADIMIANNKYHPHMTQAKKLPPVALRSKPPNEALPTANIQKVLVANPNPMVAPMKTRTKAMLVRREQIRKMKDSIVMDNA